MAGRDCERRKGEMLKRGERDEGGKGDWNGKKRGREEGRKRE